MGQVCSNNNLLVLQFATLGHWPQYLLDQIDGGLQVHAEIYERPGDALAFVFLLLQHKHVMIKVLLQSFVREVYAQLVETIELRDRHALW